MMRGGLPAYLGWIVTALPPKRQPAVDVAADRIGELADTAEPATVRRSPAFR